MPILALFKLGVFSIIIDLSMCGELLSTGWEKVDV